jgi:hypothetical protein
MKEGGRRIAWKWYLFFMNAEKKEQQQIPAAAGNR